MNTSKNIKYFLPAVMIVAAQGMWGQQVTVTYNSPGGPYSATIPQCVDNAYAEAWGGGGGGGSSRSSTYSQANGGGGGGGAYALKNYTEGALLSLTVGAGGARGENNANNATAGGTTTINASGYATVTVGGGERGIIHNTAATGTSGNGAGGNGGLAYGGDINLSGDNGYGGSSSPNPISSGGGSPYGGGRTAQPASTAVGIGGTFPGGGGSGGRSNYLVAQNDPGGVGANGRAVITLNFTLPVITGGNTYCAGDPLELTVANPCDSATYTWKLNGSTVQIGGTSYTVANVTTGNAGIYTIEAAISGTYTYPGAAVSASGGVSHIGNVFTLTSAGYNVTVNTPPAVGNISLTTSIYCAGDNLIYPTVPSVTSGSTVTAQGWMLDGVGISGTYPLTSSDNGKMLKYYATNACGTTYSNDVQITVNSPPSVGSISLTTTTYCAGDNLIYPTVPSVSSGIAITAQGWLLDGVGISGTYPLTTSDDGKMLKYFVTNNCGTTYSNEEQITVNTLPTISNITFNKTTYCAGENLEFPAVTVNSNITINNQGWLLGSDIISAPYTLVAADNGKTLQYFATNACGTTYSNGASITVNTPPAVGSISLSTTTYCANETLDFPVAPPSVASPITVTNQGWMLGGDIISYPYTLIAADNGKMLKYFATNNCGTGYSNEITITVVVTEITSITPASGPTTGGIYTNNPMSPIDPSGEVTITGNGFAPFGSPAVTQVSFGGVAATNVTVVDNNTLTCTPPPQISSGYVAVSVTAACGTTVLTDGYLYEAMNITEVSPDYAPVTGGNTIMIKGTGLLAAIGLEGSVTVKLCGVPATVISVDNENIVCITGPSNFSKLDSIEIYNGVESRAFPKRFTYYPVTFIVNGVWSEPYNWETQTDDRILPYPDAVIHIKANCLQDIDLLDSEPYPNGKMDSITVYPNKAYTLGNLITLDANVFTLKDNASFLNHGMMQAMQQNVEHLLSKGRNWYVSSPVATPSIDAALGTGALGGDLTTDGTVNLSSSAVASDWRVEWYKESMHSWQRLPVGSPMITGQGHTVFSANEDIAVKFSGTFNDGDQSLSSLTRQSDAHPKRGFNLVGNPFPSYWRWTAAAASSANVYSTIWYRTNVAGVYEFWSYNASGNVAVAPGWESATPTGSYSLAYIPPMQAFWVRMLDGQTGGTVSFTNSLRSHADHGSNILKSDGIANTETRPLLRIAVDNGVSTDETVIYADPAAKKEFDDYDSDKWFVNQGVEIFTQPASSTRELVINGLPGIEDGTEVILGFQADEGGAFSFRAKEILNLEALDVFLSDKWRNLEVDLRGGDYHFTSTSVPVTDRFSVVFRSVANSGLSVTEAGGEHLLAYTGNDGQLIVILYLLNQQKGHATVSVFDITGRKLAEQPVIAGERTTIEGIFPEGSYVLRAGKCVTKVMVKR